MVSKQRQHSKSRVDRACDACRVKKTKCDARRPACSKCIANNEICTFARRQKRPKRTVTPVYAELLKTQLSTCQAGLMAIIQEIQQGNDCSAYVTGAKGHHNSIDHVLQRLQRYSDYWVEPTESNDSDEDEYSASQGAEGDIRPKQEPAGVLSSALDAHQTVEENRYKRESNPTTPESINSTLVRQPKSLLDSESNDSRPNDFTETNESTESTETDGHDDSDAELKIKPLVPDEISWPRQAHGTKITAGLDVSPPSYELHGSPQMENGDEHNQQLSTDIMKPAEFPPIITPTMEFDENLFHTLPISTEYSYYFHDC